MQPSLIDNGRELAAPRPGQVVMNVNEKDFARKNEPNASMKRDYDRLSQHARISLVVRPGDGTRRKKRQITSWIPLLGVAYDNTTFW